MAEMKSALRRRNRLGRRKLDVSPETPTPPKPRKEQEAEWGDLRRRLRGIFQDNPASVQQVLPHVVVPEGQTYISAALRQLRSAIYTKGVEKKISYFSPKMVKENPFLVLNTVSRSSEGETIKFIKTWEQANSFLDSQNEYANTPGYFRKAKAFANIYFPTGAAKQVNAAIDYIRENTPSQEAAALVMRVFSDPRAYVASVNWDQERANAWATDWAVSKYGPYATDEQVAEGYAAYAEEVTKEWTQKSMDGAVLPDVEMMNRALLDFERQTGINFNLDFTDPQNPESDIPSQIDLPSSASADIAAGLRSLFWMGAATDAFSPTPIRYGTETTGAEAFAADPMGELGKAGAKVAYTALSVFNDVNALLASTVLLPLTKTIEITDKLLSTAIHGTAGTLGAVVSPDFHSMSDQQKEDFLRELWQTAEDAPTIMTSADEWIMSGARKITRAMGVEEGSQLEEQAARALTGIFELFLLKKASVALRTKGVTNKLEPAAARSELGLDLPVNQRVSGFITKPFVERFPRLTAFRPSRRLNVWIEDTVYRLNEWTPEKLQRAIADGDPTPFSPFFNDIRRKVTANPEATVADLQTYYPEISPRLLKEVLESAKDIRLMAETTGAPVPRPLASQMMHDAYFRHQGYLQRGRETYARLSARRDLLTSQIEEGTQAARTAPAADQAVLPVDLSATKVVDEAGAPRRVYHGTTEVFDQFDPATQEAGLLGRGFYFAENPDVTTKYALGEGYRSLRKFASKEEARDWADSLPDAMEAYASPSVADAGMWVVEYNKAVTGSNIHGAYLDIRNPFDVRKPLTAADLEELASGLRDLGLPDDVVYDLTPGQNSRIDLLEALGAHFGDDGAVEALQGLGYDGIRHLGSEDGNVWLAFDESQVHGGFAPPSPVAVAEQARTYSLNELNAMRAERAAVTRQLNEIALYRRQSPPMRAYPKPGKLQGFVYGSLGRVPARSKLGRAWQWFTPLDSPHVRFVRGAVEGMVDDLVNAPVIKDPWTQGAATANAETLTTYLRRAKVPPAEIARLMDEYNSFALKPKTAASAEAYYAWVKGMAETVSTRLREIGADPALIERFEQFWGRHTRQESYAGSYPHYDLETGEFLRYRPITGRPVVGADGKTVTYAHAPSYAKDFLHGDLRLPSVDLVIEGTKTLGMWKRNGGAIKKGIAYPMLALDPIMRFQTLMLKPLVLLARFPAFVSRIQLEQAARMKMSGQSVFHVGPLGVPMTLEQLTQLAVEQGYDPATFIKTVEDLAAGVDRSSLSLGTVVDESIDLVMGDGAVVAIRPAELVGKIPDGVYQGYADDIARITSHPEVRTSVLNPNMTREQFIEAVLTRDETAMPVFVLNNFHDLLLPKMRENGVGLADDALLAQWWDRNLLRLEDLWADDPRLQRAMRSGYIHMAPDEPFSLNPNLPRGAAERIPVVRAELQQTLRNETIIRKEMGRLRSKLRDGQPEPPQIAQYQEALDIFDQRYIELTRELDSYGDVNIPETSAINVRNPAALADYLKQRREVEGIQHFPQVVYAPEHLLRRESSGIGASTMKAAQSWNSWLYKPFKLASKADMAGTRGSLFAQLYEVRLAENLRMGYSPREAHTWAVMHAEDATRRLMYDLGARTSFQRATRDIFWFAPATQEIINTWVFKIPRAQAGNLFAGWILTANKLDAVVNILRGIGLVKPLPTGKDGKEELVITIPGLSDFIEGAVKTFTPWDVEVPEITFGRLTGLNLAFSGLPGLSPAPSFLLGKAARENWPGMKALAGFAEGAGMLFSMDTTLTPAPIQYLAQLLTGKPFPLEYLSPGYMADSNDRAFDQAVQYAWQEATDLKRLPPAMEDYVGDDGLLDETEKKRFQDATKAWQEWFLKLANDYQEGVALVKLLGSTVSPVSLSVTTEEKMAYQTFMDELTADTGDAEFTEEQQRLRDYWLSKHPGSLSYSVAYSHVTGKNGVLTPAELRGDEDYYQQWYEGNKDYFTQEQMMYRVMYINSYRHYAGKLDAALRDLSPTLSTPELLVAGFERKQAAANFQRDWKMWLDANEDVKNLSEELRTAWHVASNEPPRAYQAELFASVLGGLNQLGPYFETEVGTRMADYRQVYRIMAEAISEYDGDDKDLKRVQKEMNWYFGKDGPFGKYIEQTAPLWEKARKMADAGLDTTAIYEQLRTINDATGEVKQFGQVWPDPEEVIWNNKSGPEKTIGLYSLASKPPTWLTNFQLGQINAPEFFGRDQLLNDYATIEKEFASATDLMAPGSSEYESWVEWRDTNLRNASAQYGQGGAEFYNLTQMTPIERMQTSGLLKDPTIGTYIAQAKQVRDWLESAGLSARGYSADALYAKSQFYANLRAAGAFDTSTDLGRLFLELGYALPYAGRPRRGVVLAEALFFGQFKKDYIPDYLTEFGAGSVNG